jgi:hypothetical protein
MVLGRAPCRSRQAAYQRVGECRGGLHAALSEAAGRARAVLEASECIDDDAVVEAKLTTLSNARTRFSLRYPGLLPEPHRRDAECDGGVCDGSAWLHQLKRVLHGVRAAAGVDLLAGAPGARDPEAARVAPPVTGERSERCTPGCGVVRCGRRRHRSSRDEEEYGQDP